MLKVHGLVVCEEKQGNLPQYKWYVECKCGFQARLATETAVKSQFDAHLQYHGQEKHFAKETPKVEETPKQEEKKDQNGESGGTTSTPTTNGGLRSLGQVKG